jgi:integrase/recombinase XerD
VSGLYAYLVARGDTPVRVNPVPRGLMTRRQGGTMRSRMAPLVRVPRTLPRILSPEEADRLVAALRTHRDRAMVLGMLLAVRQFSSGSSSGTGPAPQPVTR